MEALISSRTHLSISRCYECFESNIKSVCHHCGKAICNEHEDTGLSSALDIYGTEFTKMGLEDIDGFCIKSNHCSDCFHLNRFFLYVTILLISFLGFIGYAQINNWDFFDYVCRITLCVPLFFIIKMISDKNKKLKFYFRWNEKPPFPIVSSINPIKVKEKIVGKIKPKIGSDSEGSAHYSIEINELSGSIEVGYTLNPFDKESFVLYKKNKLKWNHFFHAGFLVFSKGADLELTLRSDCQKMQMNTIRFLGEVKDYPYLFKDKIGENNAMVFECPYTFSRRGGDKIVIPLHVFISLVPDKNEEEIAITFQIDPFDRHVSSLKQANIKSLIIDIPQSCHFVRAEPSCSSIEMNQGDAYFKRRLEWKDILMKVDEKETTKIVKKIVYISFDHKVPDEVKFEGKIEIELDKAFSDLGRPTEKNSTAIMFFNPLGNRREDISVKEKTLLDFDLELHFSTSGLQEPWSDEIGVIEKKGIAPDFKVIHYLTAAINDGGFYIQRVIENPSYTSKESADIMNYSWDVAGRKYYELYPVDFHLAIVGKGHPSKSYLSTICIDIIVRGTITTRIIDSKEDIKAANKQLGNIIKHVLDGLCSNNSAKEKFPNYYPDFERLDQLLLEKYITEKTYLELKEKYILRMAGF
jgi:hypothetical protein